MPIVTLGLGSNIPHKGMSPPEILCAACDELQKIFTQMSRSSLYRTKAMYITAQDDFYNMVLRGFLPDDITPHELLKSINKIEADYGRDRAKETRFGPRTLDIDIEFFGDCNIDDDALTVPHPRLFERAFVLVPLVELLREEGAKSGALLKRCEGALSCLDVGGVMRVEW